MNAPELLSIDVVLVAGRRPDVVERTLYSFARQVFPAFRIANAFANIDPIFGDDEAHARTVATIRRYLPSCKLFEPAQANFSMAVKRLWSHTTGDFVLHLEDDWICNETVVAGAVAEALVAPATSLALHNRQLKWRGPDRHVTSLRRRKVLGVTVERFTIQRFGTSPRFLDGAFARGCADRMDPRLDPEKQMDPRRNPALHDYQQQFTSLILPPRRGDELISDIGREWRERMGFIKTGCGGNTRWRRTRDA